MKCDGSSPCTRCAAYTEGKWFRQPCLKAYFLNLVHVESYRSGLPIPLLQLPKLSFSTASEYRPRNRFIALDGFLPRMDRYQPFGCPSLKTIPAVIPTDLPKLTWCNHFLVFVDLSLDHFQKLVRKEVLSVSLLASVIRRPEPVAI